MHIILLFFLFSSLLKFVNFQIVDPPRTTVSRLATPMWLDILNALSIRQHTTSLLVTGCASNCKSCNIQGQNKCDPEQCEAGYVYNFVTEVCDGIYSTILFVCKFDLNIFLFTIQKITFDHKICTF